MSTAAFSPARRRATLGWAATAAGGLLASAPGTAAARAGTSACLSSVGPIGPIGRIGAGGRSSRGTSGAGPSWAAAFEGFTEDPAPLPMALHGRVPRALSGAFYRNGAAGHALGGLRYAHWFDGDGAVQRYEIRDGRITHSARFVRTEKFVAETAAGKRLRQAYGTAVPGAEPLTGPDSLNTANINVVPHSGRLLALWEGGSAHAIDARTLATLGPVRWADELAGLPFSAHPRVEPDGTMWNFGASHLQGLLTIYRIGADGRLAQHHTLRVPELPMLHDFAVTARHLVFPLPPFVFEPERFKDGALFHDSHLWRPELGLRAMVLEKARLDAPPMWFTLPAGFVFHIGNACEQAGVIRLDCMRSASAWQVQHGMMDVMCGVHSAQDHTHMMSVELDLAAAAGGAARCGRATQEVLAPAAEFPRVDPRHIGRDYRTVFTAVHMGAAPRPGYDGVMRVDMQSGRTERYFYGDDVLVEEHVFVPHAARGTPREGEGWLLGSALDVARGETLFSVFDATNLAAGPLAQARMPRLMPLGLHASFVQG
jgi:carotenoid cleavage dioxygenase